MEKIEDLDSGSQKQEPTEAEKVLGNLPSFKEHMQSVQRTKSERAQRFLQLSGIEEIRSDENLFDEKIQEMTRDDAYKYLTHLNGILRGVNKKNERGRRDNIQVGEHMAPSRDVQGIILKDTIETLKNIEDNHYRATLAYYTVNNLHLFPDGNGRTSRAVYEIFDNNSPNLDNEDFIHKTNSSNESGGHGNFEKTKGIRSAATAYAIAREWMKKSAAKEQKIDPRMSKMYSRVEMIFGETPDVYLTKDAEKNLSDVEKKSINKAFHDGDVAVICLARILSMKGTAKDIIDGSIHQDSNDRSYIVFEIEKTDLETGKSNEKAAKTFEGWTAEDYRTFLKGFKSVQRKNQQILNDIFTNPSRYPMSNGQTCADWLSRVE